MTGALVTIAAVCAVVYLAATAAGFVILWRRAGHVDSVARHRRHLDALARAERWPR